MDADGSIRRMVTITNPQGLHMRPAMAFARAAAQYQAIITVCNGDRCVNGKSLIDLMLLAAEPGVELILQLSGADAVHAVEPLAQILAAPEAEDFPDSDPSV